MKNCYRVFNCVFILGATNVRSIFFSNNETSNDWWQRAWDTISNQNKKKIDKNQNKKTTMNSYSSFRNWIDETRIEENDKKFEKFKNYI